MDPTTEHVTQDSFITDGKEADWSAKNDFDIKENLQGAEYLTSQSILKVLEKLARTNPNVARLENLSDLLGNMSIPVLHLFKVS